MTFSLLSSITKGNEDGTPSDPPIDTTNATLIIICVAYPLGTSLSISDNTSNSYLSLTPQDTGSDIAGCLYYTIHPTTSLSHTFTVSPIGISFVAAVFSSPLTPTLDQEGGCVTTGFFQTLDNTSVTPTYPNSLIVGGVTAPNPCFIGYDAMTGWTNINDIDGREFFPASALLHQIQTTITVIPPEETLATYDENATVLNNLFAIFYETSPISPPLPPLPPTLNDSRGHPSQDGRNYSPLPDVFWEEREQYLHNQLNSKFKSTLKLKTFASEVKLEIQNASEPLSHRFNAIPNSELLTLFKTKVKDSQIISNFSTLLSRRSTLLSKPSPKNLPELLQINLDIYNLLDQYTS